MLSIFRKIQIPKLTYFNLKVDISAIEAWIKNPKEIAVNTNFSNNGHNIKSFTITLLPNEPFLFYHNYLNEFSTTIAGSISIGDDNITTLEWEWDNKHFFVFTREPHQVLFCLPLSEIFPFLNGIMPTSTANGTHGKTEIDILLAKELFSKQLTVSWMRNAFIKYENSLIELTLIRPSSSEKLLYD
ncbi:hypothetical protein [Simiduia aestuariiviva]|uniref:Uncharacterized protein n=1 Tax=Simiduia aestuariiviva TaxID=1510459 RepID=A0A839UXB3_9GAMM|nr:hypothetical protein [Simiduia aestuariiviva]MBB3169965.1 hypothetical protein [Simiduia aestuariiviva]